MRMRTLRWTEALLLLAGFVCLGAFTWWKAQDVIYQSYSNYVLEQKMADQPATIAGYLKRVLGIEKAPPPVTTPEPEVAEKAPEPPREVPAIPPGGLVGRIEIPRLKLTTTVREGVEETLLKKSAGHLPDTPFPGQPGNVAIAAHRDQHFRNLRGVKMGDKIRIVTPHVTYESVVDSLKIVWPRNVEVLDPTPEPALTLVTCYPFDYVGSAPKRFIVRAKQVAEFANAAPPGDVTIAKTSAGF